MVSVKGKKLLPGLEPPVEQEALAARTTAAVEDFGQRIQGEGHKGDLDLSTDTVSFVVKAPPVEVVEDSAADIALTAYVEPQRDVLSPAAASGMIFANGYSLKALIQVGTILANSGYFATATQASQAVAKVMAGAELGLAPMASMQHINVIQGRVELSAHAMGALIRRGGRYDYAIKIQDEELCEVWFYRGDAFTGICVGAATFTIKEAARAGLVKPGSGWVKYPSDMLFARALSRGTRRYCPDIGMFPLYAPGELGDDDALPPPVAAGQAVNQEEAARLQNAKPESLFSDD